MSNANRAGRALSARPCVHFKLSSRVSLAEDIEAELPDYVQ